MLHGNRFDRALANEMTTIRKPCYHSQISPRAQGFRCARTQGRMSSEASRRIWVVCLTDESRERGRKEEWLWRTDGTDEGKPRRFHSTHLVMCMRYDHASTSRTHGPFGERTRFGETLRPFLRSRDDLPPIATGGICNATDRNVRDTEEHRRPKKSDRCIVVCSSVRPHQIQSRTAAVQVTSGKHLRACHSYGPGCSRGSQGVRWLGGRWRLRVSVSNEALYPGEVARSRRRRVYPTETR